MEPCGGDPLVLVDHSAEVDVTRFSWDSEGRPPSRGVRSEPLSRPEVDRRSTRRLSEPGPGGVEARKRPSVLSLASAYQSCGEEETPLLMRLFLLDNSGSSRKEDGCITVAQGEAVRCVRAERWQEIAAMAVVHAENCGRHRRAVPAQFVLLNPVNPWEPQEGRDFVMVDPVEGEQAQQQVERLKSLLMANGPRGNTPLAGRLKQLRTRLLQLGSPLKLTLCIVTDGLPTASSSTHSSAEDKAAFVQELQAWAKTFECSPVARLATGQASVCNFYLRLRRQADFKVGVVHGLRKEAAAAAAVGNGWLAYSPRLQWLRESGVLDGPLGLLTERALTFAEIVELLQWLLKERLPSHCPKAFVEALEPLVAGAAMVYNARLRRMSPPVDLQHLRETLGLARSLAQLGRELRSLARALQLPF